MKRMSVRLPDLEQIEERAAGPGLVLTSDETTALASFAPLDELVQPSLAPTAPLACAHHYRARYQFRAKHMAIGKNTRAKTRGSD
jgi:hypothetical protein